VDRGVTNRVKLVWLPSKNRVLAVSTVSCSEVLILMLEIWAIMSVMPELSTIVARSMRLTLQLPVVDAPYLGGSATSNQFPG
jgi:hypothetical protein